MYLLGDVHEDPRNMVEALKLERDQGPIIQVGDLGSDYGRIPWTRNTFHFIDGNHDHFEKFNPDADYVQHVTKEIMYIPRGFVRNGILYIGGAESIDKHSRIRGLDWFPQEQITYDQVYRILDNPEIKTVKTVISHCAPSPIAKRIIEGMELRFGQVSRQEFFGSTSENMLETLRQEIKPERWFFGHYHLSWQGELDGCKFRCLAPGELIKVD